jgi:hypothetical protein
MQSHPRALLATLGALLGGGGGALMASREKAREGETRNERIARIVRNGAVGAGLGAGGLAAAHQGADMLQNSAIGKSYIQKAKALRDTLFGGPIAAGGTGAAVGGLVGMRRGHSVTQSAIDAAEANLQKAADKIKAFSQPPSSVPLPPKPTVGQVKAADLAFREAANASKMQLQELTRGHDTLATHVKDLKAGAGNAVRNRGLAGAGVGAALGLAPDIYEAVADHTPQGAVLTPAVVGGGIAYAAKRHPVAAILSALTGVGLSARAAYNNSNP